MTARTVVAIASLAVGLGSTGCVSFYEVLVETPVQSKIDVTPFRRILVAGFVAGGTQSIDPNTETARLLRSQLRSKSELTVIDADVLSLIEEVDRMRRAAGEEVPQRSDDLPAVSNEADLEAYAEIFQDSAFWRSLGESYDAPLIVTGSVLFNEVSQSGMVSRPQQVVNPAGQIEYQETREFTELQGYALAPTFVFIDGRTGEQLYTESFREERLYPKTQNTPALSSYFELMDQLLPGFLNTLSTQKIRGSRILVK